MKKAFEEEEESDGRNTRAQHMGDQIVVLFQKQVAHESDDLWRERQQQESDQPVDSQKPFHLMTSSVQDAHTYTLGAAYQVKAILPAVCCSTLLRTLSRRSSISAHSALREASCESACSCRRLRRCSSSAM